MKRFSKAAVGEYIKMRLRALNRFDIGNGWSQVVGKGETLNLEYGEFRALLNLAAEFDIEIRLPTKLPVQS